MPHALFSRDHGVAEQEAPVINLYDYLNVSGCLVPSGNLSSMSLCNASGSIPYFDKNGTQALVPNSTAYFCALPKDRNTPAGLSGLIGNYSVVPINMLGCVETFTSAAIGMGASGWVVMMVAIGWLAVSVMQVV